MDESDQSNFKSSEHEQSWQIPRKQEAIFIKGMVISYNYNYSVNKEKHLWEDYVNCNRKP